jgi:hypothetical protein
MKITIEIPDEVAKELQAAWPDLGRGILEAVAVEGYRREVLGRSDVEALLGLYYDEANALLRERGCLSYMTPEEIDEAADVARRTTRRSK